MDLPFGGMRLAFIDLGILAAQTFSKAEIPDVEGIQTRNHPMIQTQNPDRLAILFQVEEPWVELSLDLFFGVVVLVPKPPGSAPYRVLQQGYA